MDKSKYPLTRFGDVVHEVREVDRNPLENGLERLIGLEHIEPENLHIKEWGLVEDGTSFTRVFRKGQVLFGKRRAYQRKVALAEFDGICSSDIIVMEAIEDKLIPELLPFIVQSEGFFDHALSTSAGSLSPRTKWKHLAEYQFPLPPKDEQRRIAEILWAADEVVEKQNIVNAKLVELRSTFVNSVIKDKSFGKFVALSKAAEIVMGQSPPGDSYNDVEQGVPLLNGPTEFGEVFPAPIQWTTDPKRFTQKDDILFCVRASVGKQNIADQKYAIGRGLAAVRGKSGIAYTGYIKIMLEALTDEVIREATGAGSTFPNITSKRLRELEIPLPFLGIQDNLTKRFDVIRKSIRDQRTHIYVIKKLRNSIINGFL